MEIRSRRLEVRVCSIWAKGRYLLGSSPGSEGASDMEMSCPLVDDFSGDGLGYSHLARWVWLAMTATLLALLMAMWALMKTSRFAMILDRGNSFASKAQACGFVSRMIVNSDAGTPAGCQSWDNFTDATQHTIFTLRLTIRRIHGIHFVSYVLRLLDHPGKQSTFTEAQLASSPGEYT